MKMKILPVVVMFALVCVHTRAQVNSGSNGSDGALDFSNITFTTNIVINMADHPNGIYQYTYVNIPTNVTMTFIPNANNSPVTWLVQNNVVINGIVNVTGQNGSYGGPGGQAGPGGWQGGNGAPSYTSGQGPGGGSAGDYGSGTVCSASYGTFSSSPNPPPEYGNIFLIPLLGGSGGGGCTNTPLSGGGGGGAILIAAAGSIGNSGMISANGGGPGSASYVGTAGGGSGGAIRLVATQINGNGILTASGGYANGFSGGQGRVRFDTYQNNFSGGINGVFTQGSQFVVIPSAGQLPQLIVTSVGGIPVSASPTGQVITPDAVLSAQQNNPIPIVVSCANLPLNTQISVSVKPANGAAVSVTGYNTTGTLASSTATISINIPRGGGLIYATAATGN